jgi:hypothetical protein
VTVSTFVAICSRNVAIIDSNAGEKLFQRRRFLLSQFQFVLGRARLQSLRKNIEVPQLLGGAALQRCGKGFVLNPASAAEGLCLKANRSPIVRETEDV